MILEVDNMAEEPESLCRRSPTRLPDRWVQLIKERLETPTGKWADYNQIQRARFAYLQGIEEGAFCPEDEPAFPDPDDYSDLTAEGEFDC